MNIDLPSIFVGIMICGFIAIALNELRSVFREARETRVTTTKRADFSGERS